MKIRRRAFYSVGLACIAAALLAVTLSDLPLMQAATSSISVAPDDKSRAPVDLSSAIIQVADKTMPAIVHIEVTLQEEVTNPLLPFEQDPFLRRFFGIPQDVPKKLKKQLRGLGSGMIVDSQGHILTNYHVAGNASKMEVVLADGTRMTAKLVGTDRKTDLAVIKVDSSKGLPFVTFGNSDRARVGEWVIAIGAPRGLSKTVTQGIISALHRRGIIDPTGYEDFLQTDAPINPGNSGGPLLNLYGEVIGVNAVIASESGGFEGIGFTIPSNMAVHVARELIAHGKVERGWIGVSIEPTPADAKAKGVRVADVVKGSPAEKAGLQKGDVITRVNDKEVTDPGQLQNEITAMAAGKTAALTVVRGGKTQTVNVTVGRLEDSTKLLASSIRQRLGAEVRPITEKEAKKYGLDETVGVVLSGVDKKGPAAQAGLEVSDVILSIGDQAIDSVDTFVQLISRLPAGQDVPMIVADHRTGKKGMITIKLR